MRKIRRPVAPLCHKTIESFPYPLNEMGSFEMEELVQVMQEPVRAVGNCASKGQLRTLCIQLIARNIALKARIRQLEEDRDYRHEPRKEDG